MQSLLDVLADEAFNYPRYTETSGMMAGVADGIFTNGLEQNRTTDKL